ncbi:MAG: hotdog fold thioesterase [Sedimentisphaerales bacterium]|nr:hotdog fold thioesterase [Sedimentisphaerales bacterium]
MTSAELEQLKQFFLQRDRFAKAAGIDILEIKPGYAKCSLEVKDQHLNGVNIVQGGAIFTLADLAFAAASNSHGTVAVAVEISITYMKAVAKGTLYAEAREVAVNPKLGTYIIEVTDDAGDVVSSFQGLAYRKKNPISEFFSLE